MESDKTRGKGAKGGGEAKTVFLNTGFGYQSEKRSTQQQVGHSNNGNKRKKKKKEKKETLHNDSVATDSATLRKGAKQAGKNREEGPTKPPSRRDVALCFCHGTANH